MISQSLKKDFSLIKGKVYVSNLIFAQDPLFNLYTDKNAYKEYLHQLSEKVPKKLSTLLKLQEKFILENVVLLQTNNPLLYQFTDNLVIANIDINKGSTDIVKQICGSLFVYTVIHNFKDKNLIRFIAPAVNCYTKLLLKCSQRPVDNNELYPEIGRVLSVWFLKLYGVLTLKNLNTLLSSNNISFVSAADTQKLFELAHEFTDVDVLLNYISQEIKTTKPHLLTTAINRYTIDFLLGLESLFLFVYMTTIASSLAFPANLYYFLNSLHDKRLLSISKMIIDQSKKILK